MAPDQLETPKKLIYKVENTGVYVLQLLLLLFIMIGSPGITPTGIKLLLGLIVYLSRSRLLFALELEVKYQINGKINGVQGIGIGLVSCVI